MSEKNTLMCASPKGKNTEIPEDFSITKCKPSRRGMKREVTRPRKSNKILSWDVVESLAPEGNLSFEEQEGNRSKVIRRLSPEEAAESALKQVINAMKEDS